MSFESHKWSEKCTRSDLRWYKIQKFPGEAVLPVGGSGGMPPQEILDPLRSLLVHFSDHLWLSNDMSEMTIFLVPKFFMGKWSRWTIIPGILVPRTNFFAGPNFRDRTHNVNYNYNGHIIRAPTINTLCVSALAWPVLCVHLFVMLSHTIPVPIEHLALTFALRRTTWSGWPHQRLPSVIMTWCNGLRCWSSRTGLLCCAVFMFFGTPMLMAEPSSPSGVPSIAAPFFIIVAGTLTLFTVTKAPPVTSCRLGCTFALNS